MLVSQQLRTRLPSQDPKKGQVWAKRRACNVRPKSIHLSVHLCRSSPLVKLCRRPPLNGLKKAKSLRNFAWGKPLWGPVRNPDRTWPSWRRRSWLKTDTKASPRSTIKPTYAVLKRVSTCISMPGWQVKKLSQHKV